jgi:hypothetical protein
MGAAELTVFCLVFDPSPLPPGAYELAVKVLDHQEHELAARALGFTRAADY